MIDQLPVRFMIVTTTNDIQGYSITAHCGVVRGIVVRSPNIAQGLMGAFGSILGGNIRSYADVCESARTDAYQLMVEHARALGADGILAMRYDSTEFMQGTTEVLAYGTAVKLSRI